MRKKMQFDHTLSLLEKERDTLILSLKNGDKDSLEHKVEIEQAISWLRKLHHLQIAESSKCRFIRLPDSPEGQHGYFFSYRIMNDCESDDRNDWIELKDETGRPVSLLMDDYLVRIRW